LSTIAFWYILRGPRNGRALPLVTPSNVSDLHATRMRLSTPASGTPARGLQTPLGLDEQQGESLVLIDGARGILISVDARPSASQHPMPSAADNALLRGLPSTTDGSLTEDISDLSPYAVSSRAGSQLLLQGTSSTNSTLQRLERGRRIERLPIRPRALFGNDQCNGMANGASLFQSLLGLGASATSVHEMKLYHQALSVANSPAFAGGVKDVQFYRMLPSPGSLSVEPTPAMRMASIFDRLGTT